MSANDFYLSRRIPDTTAATGNSYGVPIPTKCRLTGFSITIGAALTGTLTGAIHKNGAAAGTGTITGTGTAEGAALVGEILDPTDTELTFEEGDSCAVNFSADPTVGGEAWIQFEFTRAA